MLDEIEKHKAAVDEELGRQSLSQEWGAQVVRLMQIPGVGVIVAMTVLPAIGDISRFENAKQLVGYAGMGAGVVEAAWRAVCMSPFWKEQYEKFLRRLRKPNQAIVVMARKLLVVIWHVLSKEETDIHAVEQTWPTKCCCSPGA